MKGNESLQRLLNPFRKAATRKFPQIETEAALAKLAQEVDLQRQELDVIRQYTEISKLNFIGTTGTAGHGLKEETGISRVLEGAYTTDNVRSQYSCDSVALAKFQEVIAKFPTFPFSYYALAFCLRQRDDKFWQGYAMKAIEILDKTTRIDGHHRNHEQALREIRAALHS
ncbi:MAG: hypothetical protein EXR70_17380 [Deltaproteobacteria bacterium]|nr:hypothetical protein [Deltaproteobacteria bacterium]